MLAGAIRARARRAAADGSVRLSQHFTVPDPDTLLRLPLVPGALIAIDRRLVFAAAPEQFWPWLVRRRPADAEAGRAARPGVHRRRGLGGCGVGAAAGGTIWAPYHRESGGTSTGGLAEVTQPQVCALSAEASRGYRRARAAERLGDSFWVLPAIFLVAGAALAAVTVHARSLGVPAALRAGPAVDPGEAATFWLIRRRCRQAATIRLVARRRKRSAFSRALTTAVSPSWPGGMAACCSCWSGQANMCRREER